MHGGSNPPSASSTHSQSLWIALPPPTLLGITPKDYQCLSAEDGFPLPLGSHHFCPLTSQHLIQL